MWTGRERFGNVTNMRPVIKVIPGKFPRGGFVAALIVGGSVIVDCWGQTKAEARKEVKRAAEEMGLWTDGQGWGS